MKLTLLATLAFTTAFPSFADWAETLEEAKGQTVYWNAWGGDPRTNDFIEWVSQQTEAQYGVKVEQVKLTDTAEAVNRVIAETGAGNIDKGSVDMIWINGGNFLSMKEQGLLHGPFVADLPNAQYLDLSETSAASLDFTTPVEGLESPWRLAKFVFVYDSAKTPETPNSMTELLAWAETHKGRVTHPRASDFMGATFLKQALVELVDGASSLQTPATDETFSTVTAPLWEWYDALKPNLWREGTAFPENQSVQQQMLNDGELDLAMSFDPASTAGAIAEGSLPETARVFVPEGGSIGNISFVAIPINAEHTAGAEVVANFLLDPETQAHMQNIEVLGAYSVLDPAKLSAEHLKAFGSLPTSPALPSVKDLGPTLNEPHASWMEMLTAEWEKRYVN